MVHAVFTAQYGSEGGLAGELLYPLGFIYIIIGNYQLYTENTLPPVALVLERLASVPRLLRIWIVVFLANAVGAGIGTYVLANTGVLSVGAVEAASTFGTEGLESRGGTCSIRAYSPASSSPASSVASALSPDERRAISFSPF